MPIQERSKKIQVETRNIQEQLLSNPAFMRVCGGFELYQNLLHAQEDVTAKNVITSRMNDLYALRLIESNDAEQQLPAKQAMSKIIESVLQDCQRGDFSREHFADTLATSPISQLFLTEWNRQSDEVEEGSNMIHVNDVVAYRQENDHEMSLHIRPTGVASSELFPKVISGFKAVQSKLTAGEIHTDRIVMKSWLLNTAMEEKAKMVLGNEISIADCAPDDIDVAAIQYLALQYNNRSLEKYLTTGEKPEVRQVVMTKDEFIARFKKI